MARVRELAPEDQIGPRPTKQGSVDLTGAKLFFNDLHQHAQFVDVVAKHGSDRTINWEVGRDLKFHAVVRMMLRALHSLHSFWNRPNLLTETDLSHYLDSVSLLTKTWTALGWKPTVWLHWVCAHSGYYMATFRSLYTFSSIPTE